MEQIIERHRPEHAFLIQAVRSTRDRIQLDQLLQTDLDWELTQELADRHSVLPLLYRCVSSDKLAVPPEVSAHLRSMILQNSARCLYLAKELCDVVDAFLANGIESIPFKGPVAALQLYDNIALRQYTDLDVLVSDHDFDPASDTLAHIGYSLHQDVGWQRGFAKGNTSVDLHARLTPNQFVISLPYESVSLDTCQIRLSGRSLTCLSPQANLMMLAAQLVRDHWSDRLSLGKICDLDGLLSSCPIDGATTLNRVAKVGNQRSVLVALCVSERLLGTNLPDALRSAIEQDSIVESLVDDVCRRLFSNQPRCHASRLRFYMLLTDVKRHRFSLLTELLRLPTIHPTQSDYEFIKLPGPLQFLYWVIRPLRLAIVWCRTCVVAIKACVSK